MQIMALDIFHKYTQSVLPNIQRRNLGTGIDIWDETRFIVKGSELSYKMNLSTVSGAISHMVGGGLPGRPKFS